MLFYNHGSRVLAISQPAHTWISGQLLRAWAEPLGEPLLLAVPRATRSIGAWTPPGGRRRVPLAARTGGL